MTRIASAGTYRLGARTVNRLGYGAMQLAGPGVFGPPRDTPAALAVLREAMALGINHLDTSDFYGPHITNQLLREALHPYRDDLVIVTKVGAVRGDDASWKPAFSAADLERAVHDNLRHLGLDVLDVVNLRAMFDVHGPAEGSIEAPLTALAELQRRGLIRHIGLSNVTPTQIAQGRTITPIVCVQNHYNLVHRGDDALIDQLADSGTAYVPFFPLGAAVECAQRCGRPAWRDADAGCACMAAAPVAEHPAHSRHVLRGASSGEPGECGARPQR